MADKDNHLEKNATAFKAGIWYTVSSIVLKATAIITTPIYTRMMSTHDYGVASTFTSWYSMLLIICSLDLVMSIGRAKQDFPNELENYIGSMQLLSGLFTSLLFIVGIIFVDPISDLTEMEPALLILLAIYLFFSPVITFAQARYRYQYKYKENIGITFFNSLSTIVLTLCFLLFIFDSNKYYGKILGTIIPVVILGAYFWLQNLRNNRVNYNKEYWVYALKVSLPMLFHSVSLNLLSTSDRVVISKMCGSESTAIYTLAYQYAILINIIMNSVSQAWQPWFHDNYFAGNKEAIRNRSNILVLFGCVIGLGCISLAPEAIFLLGPEAYQSGVSAVAPIALGIVCQFMYSNYINIELHLKNTKYASIGTMLAAIINVVLNIIFIPYFGYVAAAYTTLFSYIVLWIIHFGICRYILKVRLYTDSFFLLCFIGTAALSIIFGLFQDSILARLLLMIGIGMIFLWIVYHSDLEIVLKYKKLKNKKEINKPCTYGGINSYSAERRDFMKSKVLNIAIIGIGHSHAEGVVSEIRKRNDLFNIVGIVEKEEIWDKKKTLPTFSGLKLIKKEDVLSKKIKVDGIVVEDEMKNIISTCVEFLALKVPIHLDKPTGLDDQFIKFAEAAKAENIPFQIGYMYRYQPAIMELKKQIEKENAIGQISQFDITMDTDLSEQNRKKLICPYPGGSMFVFGSHLLDLVTSIMGFPTSTHVYLGKSGFDGIEAEDNCIALLYYDRCCAVIKTNVVSANGYIRRHLVISGTNGSVSIEPLEKPTIMKYTKRKSGGNGGDGSIDLSHDVDLENYKFKRRYQFMMENFAYMIMGQTDETAKNKMYVKMDYEYEMNLHNLLLEIIGVKPVIQTATFRICQNECTRSSKLSQKQPLEPPKRY